MRNLEIASVFSRVADLLEIQDANPFRIRAYRRAATTLEGLTDNIEVIAARGGLRDIPGVGEDLATKISEYLATGAMGFYERLKEEVPIGIVKMVAVPGVGPKTAKAIHERFQITNIDELEALCKTDQLLEVPGFKKKTIDNILRGIEILRRNRGSHLLGRAMPVASQLCRYMESYADHVSLAGSLRRMKEVVHDVDILAASNQPEKVTAAFIGMPLVAEVLANGPTKLGQRPLQGGLDLSRVLAQHGGYEWKPEFFEDLFEWQRLNPARSARSVCGKRVGALHIALEEDTDLRRRHRRNFIEECVIIESFVFAVFL